MNTHKRRLTIKKPEQLPPAQFIPLIEERIAQLEQALKTKQYSVKHTPAGQVRIVQNKGSLQFYRRESQTDTQGTYMPRSQDKLAHALIQNAYDQDAITAIQAELKYLRSFLKVYKNKSTDNLYKKLNPPRRQIVEPLTLDDIQYAEQWLNVEYKRMKFPAGQTPLLTDNNDQVRSKSEVIIANELKATGVPYRYEFPLLMDKNAATPDFPDYDFCNLHPDFYCLNLRTRKEYAWEHFGMMDDPEYAARTAEKLALYAQNGFYPGKNLIITMETTKQPLSSQTIKGVIAEYLK